MPGDSNTPRAVYQGRLETCRAAAGRFERQHRIAGYAKLAAIAAAIVLGFVALVWVPVALLVFLILTIAHGRILREREQHSRAASFYEAGLARLEGHWIGKGEAGDRFCNPEHAYSDDLDLFGRGSLFQLLCTARTNAGQRALATWLLEPAAPELVRARNAAVAELRSLLDFRQDLAVAGEEPTYGAVPERFVEWVGGRPVRWGRTTRILGSALGLFALFSILAWTNWNTRLPAIAAILLNGTFWLSTRRRADEAAEEAEHAARDLRLLSLLLGRMERESFSAPRLVELRAMLNIAGHRPSNQIAKLHRLMEMLESRHNWLVRLIDPLFFWTFHWCSAVENWRRRAGPAARQWLGVVAEMEALSSLACYLYEHPCDPFPEFIEHGPCFHAEGLAHPLLMEGSAVPNDLRLDGDQRVHIVSGSNMSGKSTLLRAVGVNAVLGQCGAPVRATRVVMTPLAIGASIRIVDSLEAGTSRFYAEIKRIRQIVDLCPGRLPVLFLLDELLHGTNSHDRRIGAEAVVRALVQRGAIGLLTTHDLALASIVSSIGHGSMNVHFEDRLENGRLHFDYRLRSGVVKRSNALHLMRSVGLDV
jgi:hypothetical protein